MFKRYFLEELGISKKDFFIVFDLLLNAFIWYYMTLSTINNISSNLAFTDLQTLIVLAVYYVAITGSSIAGSILSDKIARLHFLYLWMIFGAATSLLPIMFNNISIIHFLITCVLWGVSFGVGMPSCLAYFADCSLVENRGRVGGTIFLITMINFLPVAIFFGSLRFNMTANYMILMIWRVLGLIVFFLLKPEEKFSPEVRKHISFASVFQNRNFVLYFIPWLMFCLVERFEEYVVIDYLKTFFEAEGFYIFVQMTGLTIGSLFAFIGGVLSDWVGRKRIVILGFIALGLAYATIGIAPTILFSWYLYAIVDGIAWGLFFVSFILILWGDLSQLGAKEKYYVIGNIPFFLTGIMQLVSAPYVKIPASSAFSLASFFLFVAVLPLMYASETLPEKKIELRRLRKYAEKAKKVKEKFVEKSAED